MRSIAVVVLVLIAAFAGPLRQACGTTCVEPVPPPQREAAESCHKPAASDPAAAEPAPADVPEHCAHDHNASLNPASRFAMTADAAAAPVFLSVAVHLAPAVIAPPVASGLRQSSSPPIRPLVLRI